MRSGRRGSLSAFFSRHPASAVLLYFRICQACLPPGTQNQGLVTGSPTRVCLVVSSANWTVNGTHAPVNQYSRLSFSPIADKFSRLVVSDSYSNNTAAGMLSLGYGSAQTPIAIHIESMGIVSYQKYYQVVNSGVRRTFPIFSAIINVNKGVVQSVAFDDGCILCNNNIRCVGNTFDYRGQLYSGIGSTSDCYVEGQDCQSDPSKCQLTVYVTWQGTDKNGNYLTSSTRRFSMFSRYSVQSFFNGLGKAALNVKYNAYNSQ